jgi:hypothetical protein
MSESVLIVAIVAVVLGVVAIAVCAIVFGRGFKLSHRPDRTDLSVSDSDKRV